jgi:hypothetical protein
VREEGGGNGFICFRTCLNLGGGLRFVSISKAIVFFCDGKDGVERVIVVIFLEIGAGFIEAFDVEEGAVEEFELFWWVVCSLR